MKQFPGYVVAEKNSKTRKILKEAFMSDASRFLTICEQIRFIYDSVEQLPDSDLKEDITEKLIDAFSMGKKMNARLAHYKRTTGDRSGTAGANLVKLLDTKKRKRLRRERQEAI